MTTAARIKLALCALGAVLLLVVIAQNFEAVETRILFTTVTMPRAALLLISVLIGFVLGLVTALTLRGPRKSA